MQQDKHGEGFVVMAIPLAPVDPRNKDFNVDAPCVWPLVPTEEDAENDEADEEPAEGIVRGSKQYMTWEKEKARRISALKVPSFVCDLWAS